MTFGLAFLLSRTTCHKSRNLHLTPTISSLIRSATRTLTNEKSSSVPWILPLSPSCKHSFPSTQTNTIVMFPSTMNLNSSLGRICTKALLFHSNTGVRTLTTVPSQMAQQRQEPNMVRQEMNPLEKPWKTVEEFQNHWNPIIMAQQDPHSIRTIIHQYENLFQTEEQPHSLSSLQHLFEWWIHYQNMCIKNHHLMEKEQSFQDISHTADKVDTLIRTMQSLYDKDPNEFGTTRKKEVTEFLLLSYEKVLSAWGKVIQTYRTIVASKDGTNHKMLRHLILGVPQRATLLFESMERLSSFLSSSSSSSSSYSMEAKIMLPPTIETYNTILEIWGNSDEHYRCSMAQSIYQKLQPSSSFLSSTNTKSTMTNLQPNRTTFQTMIQTWCRHSLESPHSSKNKTKNSSAAFHATNFLIQMHSQLEGGRMEYEPTLEDYKHVLQAWSRTKCGKKTALRALSILHKMEYLYTTRIANARSDTECYKYVLETLSNSPIAHVNDAGDQVDRLFTNMSDRNLLPDSDCFTSAIQTWRNSSLFYSESSPKKAFDCAKRAEYYLKQMAETYYRSSTVVVRPKTFNYNHVIQAYTHIPMSAAVKRAENILFKMEILYKDGDVNSRPDRDSYVSVILGWAQLSDPRQVGEARKLLERMQVEYSNGNESCQISTKCYNAVLSACCGDGITLHGSTTEKDEALRFAFTIVQKMKSSPKNCQPDSSTYTLLMKVIAKLIPDGSIERNKALDLCFKNCCIGGLVDADVLATFRRYAPEELYTKSVLLATSRTDTYQRLFQGRTLPPEWTINSKGRKARVADGSTVPIPLTVEGNFVNIRSPVLNEYKMKKLRSKVNQHRLQGGRS